MVELCLYDDRPRQRAEQTFALASDPGFEELGDKAREKLLDGQTWRLPWGLGLMLLDYMESEGRDEAWRRRRCPDWLSDEDADLLALALLDLGLPPPTRFSLKLRKHGSEGRRGFRLDAVWVNERDAPLSQPLENVGLMLREPSGALRRPSHGQYRLLGELAALTGLGTDTTNDLWTSDRLAHKVLKDEAGVRIDTPLQKQQFVLVDAVSPHLRQREDGTYEVRPQVSGLADKDLQPYFDDTPTDELGSGIHSVLGPKLARTRVAWEERPRRALRKLRELGHISREQAAAALSDPEHFFGPHVDTSALAERVTGLGPAVHMVIPFYGRSGERDWFAGAWSEARLASVDGEDADGDAACTSPDEHRDEIARLVAEADENGNRYIPNPVGDGFIEVNASLRAWLRHRPQSRTEDEPPRPEEQVLQVEQNVDQVSFSPGVALPGLDQVPESRPPHLRDEITLQPHQQEGFRWLTACGAREGADAAWQGALLADDMGLGKTLQVLAFLDTLASRGRPGPHLVVAPVALLDNWRDEARKFFGRALDEILVAAAGELPPGDTQPVVEFLARHRIVAVSYETLARRELLFARVKWDTVVLDEAQKTKNPATRVARVVRALDARFRLAVTGTPVENRLQELWALYDWALPGLLGSLRDFGESYVRPLQGSGSAERAAIAQQLHQRIQPVFCRRMKHDVLGDSLPRMTRHDHPVALSPAQEESYGALIAEARGQSSHHLGALIRLFGVCAHPQLRANTIHLPTYADETFPKAAKLFELLGDVRASGEKALVFANRKRLQHWLSREIEQRFDGPVPVINGDVTGSHRRLEIIRRWERRPGFAALVLSPRAAGLGLNITAANHVIHYTREWNPAVENQATDRVYRMGQRRPVHVHTITTHSDRAPTAEQHLADLLEEKRRLMADFVVPTESFEIAGDEIMARVLS